MSLIYHVATKAEWDAAKKKGLYEAASLKTEGFIHCSDGHQVAGVIERFFEGQTGLVKLVIETNKLTSKLVFDWSPSISDTFPHIYGKINLDAVTEVIAL